MDRIDQLNKQLAELKESTEARFERDAETIRALREQLAALPKYADTGDLIPFDGRVWVYRWWPGMVRRDAREFDVLALKAGGVIGRRTDDWDGRGDYCAASDCYSTKDAALATAEAPR